MYGITKGPVVRIISINALLELVFPIFLQHTVKHDRFKTKDHFSERIIWNVQLKIFSLHDDTFRLTWRNIETPILTIWMLNFAFCQNDLTEFCD